MLMYTLRLFYFRYDYLEFTDSGSRKQRFDGEVSGDRWPKKAEFKGQKLHFVFYSDGSNNEWGYKFTVSHVIFNFSDF